MVALRGTSGMLRYHILLNSHRPHVPHTTSQQSVSISARAVGVPFSTSPLPLAISSHHSLIVIIFTLLGTVATLLRGRAAPCLRARCLRFTMRYNDNALVAAS